MTGEIETETVTLEFELPAELAKNVRKKHASGSIGLKYTGGGDVC